VFGSYGWSGEAIDLMKANFATLDFSLGLTPPVKFKPTDVTLKLCEAGTDFAHPEKKKVREPRQPATNVEQALGRVVGSLSVVTAKLGDSVRCLPLWV